jgi:hypothetical protein
MSAEARFPGQVADDASHKHDWTAMGNAVSGEMPISSCIVNKKKAMTYVAAEAITANPRERTMQYLTVFVLGGSLLCQIA